MTSHLLVLIGNLQAGAGIAANQESQAEHRRCADEANSTELVRNEASMGAQINISVCMEFKGKLFTDHCSWCWNRSDYPADAQGRPGNKFWAIMAQGRHYRSMLMTADVETEMRKGGCYKVNRQRAEATYSAPMPALCR